MKIKQENSGIPKQCLNFDGSVNDQNLTSFVKEYKKHEGVTLNKNDIQMNTSKRTVMKAILNSLWGKFAQADSSVNVEYFEDYYDFLNLVNNRTKEVTSVEFITPDVLRATHKLKETCSSISRNRNVVIAAFVTSYARLELLNVLHSLNEKVLYYDTDSVIYISNGKNDIKTGNFLGDLTNELVDVKTGEENHIIQFCSSGPKSYSYITNNNEEIVHAKGFSFQGDAKTKITFESIRECVNDNEKEIEIIYKEKISHDNQQNIFITEENKIFKFTFDKRVVKEDFFTLPFGY